MQTARSRNPGVGVVAPSSVLPGQPRHSVFRAFMQNPFQTGAITASGAPLSRKLVTLAGLEDAGLIVELGTGTGAVTRHILDAGRADCHLICFELDQSMAYEARLRFPGAEVLNADAQRLPEVLAERGYSGCDAIISSIPWASISSAKQQSLLNAVSSALGSEGCFVTFAYVHGLWLPGARRFYQALCSRFASVTVSEIVWANLPPAIVYTATGSKPGN